MYRLSLATSAVNTVSVRKLLAAQKFVACTSTYNNNILFDCLNASSTAVQHNTSLHQLLQVLSTHTSCQDTSVVNALLNKLISFDVDDSSSLAIAQAVTSTATEASRSSIHCDERVQSSPSLIVEVMKMHKQSLSIRAKCARCLANMCLINKNMYENTATSCDETETINITASTTTSTAKVSNVLVEQLLDDGVLELVLGTMQMFHSVKAEMLRSLQFNESKERNTCTNKESQVLQEVMSGKNDVCEEEIIDSVDIWKQCSWVTLACCNLICLSEGGVKRGVQLNGIEILTEFIFLLLSMTKEVESCNAFSTNDNIKHGQVETERNMCFMLLNRSLDSCMASLTALLTSEVQLENEHKVEEHHHQELEKLHDNMRYRKSSELEEMPLSAVNNYNYQQVSYSTVECIVLLTIYASQCVSSNLCNNEQETVKLMEMAEENNLSSYLELLHKSWMALQYIASYKPNVSLLYSVLYDLLELHEVEIDTTDLDKCTSSEINDIHASTNAESDLQEKEKSNANKSKTHGLWLFNSLWRAAWHFVDKSLFSKGNHLKASPLEKEIEFDPSQTSQLAIALHYSVLCVLNALLAPREDVINTSITNNNSNSNRIFNKNVVTNINSSNDNKTCSSTSSSSSSSFSSDYSCYISPSLSAQVVYRLITTNDVICHNFALSTITQILNGWRQQQEMHQHQLEETSCSSSSHSLQSHCSANVPAPFTLDEYKLLREALLLLHHLTLQVGMLNCVKDIHGAKWHDSNIKGSHDSNNINSTEEKKLKKTQVNNTEGKKNIEECDNNMGNIKYMDEEANDLISVNTLIVLQHIMSSVKWTITGVNIKYKRSNIKQLFSQMTECKTEADKSSTTITATESVESSKLHSAHFEHNVSEYAENKDKLQINANDKTLLLQQLAFAGYIYSIVWNYLAALSHHSFQSITEGKCTVDSVNNNDNNKNDLFSALYCALMNDELNLIRDIEEVQHMLTSVYMQAREDAKAEFAARHTATVNNNSKEESAMCSENTPWTSNAFEETLSKLITLGEQLLSTLTEMKESKEN